MITIVKQVITIFSAKHLVIDFKGGGDLPFVSALANGSGNPVVGSDY